MAPEIVDAYRALAGPRLRFAETDDVLPLLKMADVMVSDTSSILHEFLVQHKPVVTFRNRRPGPHLLDVQHPADVRPALLRALERPPDLLRAIATFAESIHPYRDGRSSERVLQATRDMITHRAGLAPRPLNLWRRLQLRRRLGYYRWR
jgi:CDP-glycerol glycerophosphotransferase (TagB/SpsB family)